MSATYFAQVTNGVVTDIAVTSAEFMAANPERYEGVWVETFIGVAGKTYAGAGFSYDFVTKDFREPPPSKPTPEELAAIMSRRRPPA